MITFSKCYLSFRKYFFLNISLPPQNSVSVLPVTPSFIWSHIVSDSFFFFITHLLYGVFSFIFAPYIFILLFGQNNVFCYFSVCVLPDHHQYIKLLLPGVMWDSLVSSFLCDHLLFCSCYFLSTVSSRVLLTSDLSLMRKIAAPKAVICKFCTKYTFMRGAGSCSLICLDDG